MKRIRFRDQLPLLYIILASLISLVFDVWRFYSSVEIVSLSYINETIILSTIPVYYFYLRKRPLFKDSEVKTTIRNFSVLLIALYIFVLLNKQVFSSEFTVGSFPKSPDNISALFYSNSISLAALLFLLPMLLLIKNLIGFRYKKRTRVYALTALGSGIALTIWTVIFKIPPALITTFSIPKSSVYQQWSSEIAIITSVLFGITLLSLFLLSLRNSWITYLRKKEKASFFILSAIMVWLVIYIFDFAFADAVPAHSLVLGVFSNLAWLFLLFYSILAGLNLFMHLPTARVFDRKMNEVASLHDLSRAISVEADFKTIVQLLVDRSAEVLETQYTWLEIYNKLTDTSYVAASKNLSRTEIKALNKQKEHSISNQILQNQQPVIINEFSKNAAHHEIMPWKENVGSLAGVPISGANGELFGILFTTKSATFAFDPDDVQMLEAYANQASIAFENAELMKKFLARERMEQELQIAREVQLRLLPQEKPTLEHLSVESLTIPAYEVGGDYYDFYQISDTGLGLIIGDVSGKGTSAAFYMAETKGIIQSLARTLSSPRDILVQANKILYPSMERKAFISLLAAFWDGNTGTLHFARAGHCPVIHFSAEQKSIRQYQPPGMAIGLDKGKMFEQLLAESSLITNSGDILAFYTDGLSEARNKSGEEFGEERLSEAIMNYAYLPLEELKQTVIDTILKFLDGQALHDDLTLILLKIK